MAQSYTFYLANAAPRSPDLNQGMWRWLEDAVRAWAVRYGEVYVVTGTLFEQSRIRTVASGRVAIPESFYKIVVRPEGDDLAAIAVIVPNDLEGLPAPPGTRRAGPRVSAEEADAFLVEHLVTIDAVERAAALPLLPALPAAIKRTLAPELWPRQ
jgi:DNA/RNA endonuclease G (NUC1)